jgi:hypothetical protein
MSVKITNIEECKVIYGFELTEDEKKEFDYHSPEGLEEQIFVKYRNNIYDISQFMSFQYGISAERIREGNFQPFGEEWNNGGYYSETYFSGVLCLILDEETVKMATYMS